MPTTPSITWNPEVKLFLSDVDETIADLYLPAEPAMITELISLLEVGKKFFFITGQGQQSVQWRIIDHLPQALRKDILIGPCSGAEVWGFNQDGTLRSQPFYSVYNEEMNDEQKKLWRELIEQLVGEFKLKTYPTMPLAQFKQEAGDDPLAIMLEDRGPQITFEVVNGYDLSLDHIKALEVSVPETHGAYDLRIPILKRAEELFEAHNLPITPRLGGIFAIDFAVKHVSKTTAVKFAIENEHILQTIGLSKADLENPAHLEVWGDKFSVIRGGTDRHMSEAVSPQVRSISFRAENPEEFMPGYNTVVWDGEKHLHEGTLEYLQSRKK